MSRLLFPLVLALLLSNCVPSSNVRLQDINPSRTYNAAYDQVLDAIRMYAMKEGFKLDRFETEYGTIIGHKTATSGGRARTETDAMSQVIVMKLSVKRQTEQRTDLNASFSYGALRTTQTKEDEQTLVYHYTSFFDYLNEALKM